jgi:hypothetical protein
MHYSDTSTGGMLSGLSCHFCCGVIIRTQPSGRRRLRLVGSASDCTRSDKSLREPPRPHNDLALITLFTPLPAQLRFVAHLSLMMITGHPAQRRPQIQQSFLFLSLSPSLYCTHYCAGSGPGPAGGRKTPTPTPASDTRASTRTQGRRHAIAE